MTGCKVVRLLAGDGMGTRARPGELCDRWSRALAPGPPVAGRPTRVAVAEPLPGFPPPPCAAVDLQWFPDLGAARANEAWLRSTAPDLADASGLIVAEEVVLRGGDYLGARWEAGGERFTMMSFAKRNPRLTPAEFSARWRAEAGRLGGERIPDGVRGLAYVQNHPVPLADDEWPFDAINEVYFDELDGLRRRADWFAAKQDAALQAQPDAIFSPTETSSLFARQIVVG
jgi:hypothetical protein